MEKANTAERLRQIMSDRNLRQVDILNLTVPHCQKYNVKMNKSDISQYCSGKVEPNQEKLFVLGLALNVSEAWLMGYDVPMSRNTNVSNINNGANINHRTGIRIPVYGRVAAGIPIEMITDIVDEEEITEELARRGEYFGLTIHGDSMEPRIWDGDIVIVRSQDDAESGELVIATVNGSDATCKRLKKYDGGIWLMSTNTKYEPMNYTNEEIRNKPVKILGKVVEVRGKLE